MRLNNQNIGKEFFLNETAEVAKLLLGKLFVKTRENEIKLAGKIVETEAYLSSDDLASHSATGLTRRNAPMFEEGGILYVYKIYGIHHCINFVTEAKGKGAAVLIRALEPVEGIETMMKNRNTESLKSLCKGPANVTAAFGLSLGDNYSSLLGPEFFVCDYQDIEKSRIGISGRIGITKSAGLKLRFFILNSEYVSGQKKYKN